jgi:glyoxylase-like metal-dependent hydrolase (beta-lactamase superfamily II)
MIPNSGDPLMTKIELAPGIVQYQFPPREDKHYGFSLVVLLNEESKSALLIDTGYEEHASAVLADLVAMGYALWVAVISHFHPDHILGLQALPKIDIIGSPKWEETLLHYGTLEELRTFVPTQITSQDTGINFGRFHLDFRPAPGHAPCSQYTVIDKAFIHVADNVMTSNDGQDILPWAELDTISDHIASLELLRDYKGYTFLLSHGRNLVDEQLQMEAIENRVRYFQNILKGKGSFSYEQATQGCTREFLHQEWLIRKE